MNKYKALKALANSKKYFNRTVKPEYRFEGTAKEFKDMYLSEMMNTGSVEIPGRLTLLGNPVML